MNRLSDALFWLVCVAVFLAAFAPLGFMVAYAAGWGPGQTVALLCMSAVFGVVSFWRFVIYCIDN